MLYTNFFIGNYHYPQSGYLCTNQYNWMRIQYVSCHKWARLQKQSVAAAS